LISNQWRILRRDPSGSAYKPIADYGLIGDKRTCALVGVDGSIDWLCIPRFDSPSIFGALLDANKGGRFEIAPKDDKFEVLQQYDGLTNILLTDFRTTDGQVRITDFMPCFRVSGLVVSTGEVHRRITGLQGTVELRLNLEPRMNYGMSVPSISKVGKLGYSITPKEKESGHELGLIVSSENVDIGSNANITSNFKVRENQTLDVVLRFGALRLHHSQFTYTSEKLRETSKYWRNLAALCKYRGQWKDYVSRSSLLLHLLVYAPTGAIVAAPTTSLPERIGGVRNWDYRYSWIRDSSFVLWAFRSIGDNTERGFLDWLTSIFYLTVDNLQVMLGITGELDLDESDLPHLEGYMKSHPVRVGNGAWNQFQLDLYGILLDAIYFSHLHHRPVSRRLYSHIVKPLVKLVELNWEKPDCGIWEVRGERKHFVYSKVWCWVALDRAVKIASNIGMKDDATEYSRLREFVKETILEKGWNPEVKAFVRSFGSGDLDAAILLLPQVGFIEATDPRMLSTIEQIKSRLLEGTFLRRYRTDDGLPDSEGAFLMCSFWLVSCLAMAGKTQEAEDLLISLVKCSNHVGLFSEEIDPSSGMLLGNFPQAFTHIGLISAVADLDRSKRKNQARAKYEQL
jgi:GH15 family glucan-1,4-alpha-glucosidase